jgi:hypothetical protein
MLTFNVRCCYVWATITRQLEKRTWLRHRLARVRFFDRFLSIVFFFILHVQKRTGSLRACSRHHHCPAWACTSTGTRRHFSSFHAGIFFYSSALAHAYINQSLKLCGTLQYDNNGCAQQKSKVYNEKKKMKTVTCAKKYRRMSTENIAQFRRDTL